MTRYELITSDEYIKVNTENIIVRGRPVTAMRNGMNEFITGLRNELLEHAQSLLSEKWIELKAGFDEIDKMLYRCEDPDSIREALDQLYNRLNKK